ncbi:MAG: hypothetical protein ACFFD4_22335 [Candidatus Odinarchaeota archaeon]
MPLAKVRGCNVFLELLVRWKEEIIFPTGINTNYLVIKELFQYFCHGTSRERVFSIVVISDDGIRRF